MEAVSDGGQEELISLLALSFVSGIGSVTARQLITHCGNAAAVFRCRRRELERIPGVGTERARAVLGADVRSRAEEELTFLTKHSIRAVSFRSADYPRRLRQCEDAPVIVYFKGAADLNPQRSVAVVGTRRISPYGRTLVEELVRQLAGAGVTVISGLAYGVDISAHRASLQSGAPTIGVVAHGLDRIYPGAHRSVALAMLERGGLLTEFPSNTRPDRDNFPARNRIVAGMTDATVVVESADRGGALITAEFANDYNRDVFAFPGRTDDEYSKGCNKLIRTNKAMLVETGEQVLEVMNWLQPGKSREAVQRQLTIFRDLSPIQNGIVEFLKSAAAAHLDEIAWKCELPVSQAAVALLELEFKGLVRPEPGKMFRLL
jgi:DNA processing protein